MLKDNGGYYYFKRWLWVQFPWIALANTELALRLYGESLLVTIEPAASLELVPGSTSQHNGSGGKDGSGVVVAAAPTAMLAATHAKPLPDPTTTFRRMWEVKKLDPLKSKPLAPVDSLHFQSMVRACVAHMAPSTERADLLVRSALADRAAVSVRIATKRFDPTPKPK